MPSLFLLKCPRMTDRYARIGETVKIGARACAGADAVRPRPHVLDIDYKRKQNRKNRKEHIPMYQVTFRFENGQEEVKAFAAPDATLLEIAKSSNVAIDAPCNGNGSSSPEDRSAVFMRL